MSSSRLQDVKKTMEIIKQSGQKVFTVAYESLTRGSHYRALTRTILVFAAVVAYGKSSRDYLS